MAQRTSREPMISIIGGALRGEDEFEEIDLAPCDGASSSSTPSSSSLLSAPSRAESKFTLAIVGSARDKGRGGGGVGVGGEKGIAKRHYRQLFIDKVNKRAAPLYIVDTGCSGDNGKKRRLTSEIAIIVRNYEADDENGGKEEKKEEKEELRFAIADVDEEEARELEQTDRAVLQSAERLVQLCKQMQTLQQSIAVVRRLMQIRATLLPSITAPQGKGNEKELLIKRRAILLRALVDSPDFTLLQFPSNGGERCAGVVFVKFAGENAEGSGGGGVTQHALLTAIGMLLELSNPQHDLAKLVDIAHSRMHYDGKGTTWTMTEQGKSLMRPDLLTWSEYEAFCKIK